MRGVHWVFDGTAFRVPGLVARVTQGSASAAQPWAGMISTPLGSIGDAALVLISGAPMGSLRDGARNPLTWALEGLLSLTLCSRGGEVKERAVTGLHSSARVGG